MDDRDTSPKHDGREESRAAKRRRTGYNQNHATSGQTTTDTEYDERASRQLRDANASPPLSSSTSQPPPLLFDQFGNMRIESFIRCLLNGGDRSPQVPNEVSTRVSSDVARMPDAIDGESSGLDGRLTTNVQRSDLDSRLRNTMAELIQHDHFNDILRRMALQSNTSDERRNFPSVQQELPNAVQRIQLNQNPLATLMSAAIYPQSSPMESISASATPNMTTSNLLARHATTGGPISESVAGVGRQQTRSTDSNSILGIMGDLVPSGGLLSSLPDTNEETLRQNLALLLNSEDTSQQRFPMSNIDSSRQNLSIEQLIFLCRSGPQNATTVGNAIVSQPQRQNEILRLMGDQNQHSLSHLSTPSSAQNIIRSVAHAGGMHGESNPFPLGSQPNSRDGGAGGPHANPVESLLLQLSSAVQQVQRPEAPLGQQTGIGTNRRPSLAVGATESRSVMMAFRSQDSNESSHDRNQMQTDSVRASSNLEWLSLANSARASSGGSTLENEDHQVYNERALVVVPLDMETDSGVLTEYQCLIRKQVCFFKATADDLQRTTQGRSSRQMMVGQVGVVCRHCANLHPNARPRGAVYFPTKLSGIYQTVQNMGPNHFFVSCTRVPEQVRDKMKSLKGNRTDSASSWGGSKTYWIQGARIRGVAERDGYLVFDHDRKDKR